MAEYSVVPIVLDRSINNYDIWSNCMEMYLLGQNLWNVIDDEEEEEEEEEISSRRSSDDKGKSWKRRNALALHAIQMSCGPHFLSKIGKLKSAKDAWDLLRLLNRNDQTSSHHNQESETREVRRRLWESTMARELSLDSSDSEIEDDTHRGSGRQDYEQFIRATKEGDWTSMETLLASQPEAVRLKAFPRDRTALHYAIDCDHIDIAQKIVDKMTIDDLEIEDRDGYTALALAAKSKHQSMLHLLKLMVSKNPMLPYRQAYGRHPITIASAKGFKDTTYFLYHVTNIECLIDKYEDQDEDEDKDKYDIEGVTFLINCINAKFFDIASELVKKFPHLLQQRMGETYPIHALANRFSAMHKEKGLHKSGVITFNWWLAKLRKFSNIVHNLLGLQNVSNDDQRLVDEARHFLRLVCAELSTLPIHTFQEIVYSVLMNAAKNGIIEFIIEMLKANPNVMESKDMSRYIFWLAVENRQVKVFNLIYGVTDKQKDSLLSYVDHDKNNILHLAAKMGSLSILDRTSNPVLIMQRELQWYKEVLKVVQPRYREELNMDNLTPRQLFTTSHAKLMEVAETSMQQTAQSSSVVGTLIVTIMFAAAFTVPGGNNQESGFPLFLEKFLFKIFIICDALSLYSSTTSVLVFLDILLSSFTEEDYLLRLPRKFMIALFALFFSITTMMIAFCTALSLMLDGQLQLILPIVLLASVPVILFLSSLLSFLSAFFMSTFGPSIFDKKTKLPLGKKRQKVINSSPDV